MSKLLKGIVSVAPGPIVIWVADWLSIFDETYIIRPNSPEALLQTAIALGAVIAVVLAATHFNTAPKTIKRRSWWAGGAAVLFLITIFGVRFLLSGSISRETAELLYLLYDAASFIFMNLVIVTILFAILYRVVSPSKKAKPNSPGEKTKPN